MTSRRGGPTHGFGSRVWKNMAGRRLKTDEHGMLAARLANEKIHMNIARALKERNFGSDAEFEAFLKENPLETLAPEKLSPLDRAQDLMYDAWQAKGKKRAEMALAALEISRDCADAYNLLAEEAAAIEESARLFEEGMKAGERGLGKEAFKENAGHFWSATPTRPYMRAKIGLAQCLWALDRHDEAIAHFNEMLALNPNDNQGVRYLLINCLLEKRLFDDAVELLDKYPDGAAAEWAYSKALLEFEKKGPCLDAKNFALEAFKANPFVPLYLFGFKKLPREPPQYAGIGDEDEAASCVFTSMGAWAGNPDALEWLASVFIEVAKRASQPKVGRNEPCPCGSGRKYKKCCLEKFGGAQG